MEWPSGLEPVVRAADELFYAYWAPRFEDWATRFPTHAHVATVRRLKTRIDALTAAIAQHQSGTFPNTVHNQEKLSRLYPAYLLAHGKPARRRQLEQELDLYEMLWS
jgi:hypothetical protein